jgi:hypothetical protein
MMNNSALNLLVLLQDNLRQRIVQDIITIVVKSDRNNDQSIDRFEAKTLALQIRLTLQEYGVEFDCEKFLMAIRHNPSASGVMAIAQKLLKSGTGDQSEDSEDDDDFYEMMFYTSDEAAKNDRRVSLVKGGSSKSGKFGTSDMVSIRRMSEKCVSTRGLTDD